MESPAGLLSPTSPHSPFSFPSLPSPRASFSASLSPRTAIHGFLIDSPWPCPKLSDSFLPPHPPNNRFSRPFSSPRASSAPCSTASPPLRKTHYSLLGVSPLSSPREIRLAYRKLALSHHPDVSPLHQLDTATKLFAEINDAYATLSDPQKRACYDLKLALEAPAATGAINIASSPRNYTDSSTGRVYPSMNSFYREWRKAHA